MNHKTGSPSRISGYLESEKVWSYTTNKVIEKGEEIFDTYGDIKSTEELAFQYGFVNYENPSTSIFFNSGKLSSPVDYYKIKLLTDKYENIAMLWYGDKVSATAKTSGKGSRLIAVSYTHLTLPTKRIV